MEAAMPKNGGTHALKWTTTPGAAEREGRGGDGRTDEEETDGEGREADGTMVVLGHEKEPTLR